MQLINIRIIEGLYDCSYTWSRPIGIHFTPDFSRFTHIVIPHRAKYLYLRIKNRTNDDKEGFFCKGSRGLRDCVRRAFGSLYQSGYAAHSQKVAGGDGGGGGVFADRWSKYLVEHLPDTPIVDYTTFDGWVDSIWEPFYNACETEAQKEGGMLLNKFYDEGSFATLVAVWNTGQWISYGDSVAFCYDRQNGRLQHSFGHLVDFNNPPYLINCKDPLNEKGFKAGFFDIQPDSIVFVASDALAHYILMRYEVAHKEEFERELHEAIAAQTKDSYFIKTAMELKKNNFEKDVIDKLQNCNNSWNFKQHIMSLRKKGLIGHDDYSLAIL